MLLMPSIVHWALSWNSNSWFLMSSGELLKGVAESNRIRFLPVTLPLLARDDLQMR